MVSREQCAACGERRGVEEHHLIPRDICPDYLTVPLCHRCHGEAHQFQGRMNISELTKRGIERRRAAGLPVGATPEQLARIRPQALAAKQAKRADYYRALQPWMQEVDHLSVRAAARWLNDHRVPAPGSPQWTATAVHRARHLLENDHE